jgi:hypothetical protein
MPITRRRLVAASGAGLAAGGAAALISACGGDGREEPSAERDTELLQRPLAAEATLSDLYRRAQRQQLDQPVAEAVEAFGEQASRHERQLTRQIGNAGGTPAGADTSPPAAESVVEAIRLPLDDAITAAHGIVGDLSSPQARRTVYEVMTANAGQLAAIRGTLGEEQVPVAFVTGRPESPLTTEDAPADTEPEGGE